MRHHGLGVITISIAVVELFLLAPRCPNQVSVLDFFAGHQSAYSFGYANGSSKQPLGNQGSDSKAAFHYGQ